MNNTENLHNISYEAKYDLTHEMLEIREKLKDDNLTEEERKSYESSLWTKQCLVEVNEDIIN